MTDKPMEYVTYGPGLSRNPTIDDVTKAFSKLGVRHMEHKGFVRLNDNWWTEADFSAAARVVAEREILTAAHLSSDDVTDPAKERFERGYQYVKKVAADMEAVLLASFKPVSMTVGAI